MNVSRLRPDSDVTLLVGETDDWGRQLPLAATLHYASLPDLNDDLLRRARPELVLSPLMMRCFDACDVLKRLADLGFRGRYRAISRTLPRPEVVRTELIACASGIDCDVIQLDRARQFRLVGGGRG